MPVKYDLITKMENGIEDCDAHLPKKCTQLEIPRRRRRGIVLVSDGHSDVGFGVGVGVGVHRGAERKGPLLSNQALSLSPYAYRTGPMVGLIT